MISTHHHNGVISTTPLSEELQEKCAKSIEVLQKIFADYKSEEIFISFNGGKDCTVLLHMIITNMTQIEKRDYKVIYIQPPENSFDEIDNFVLACEIEFNIDIITKRGRLKQVVEEMCETDQKFKACVMGCRRTDPYCEHLETFQMSDKGWPTLLRVNPLLDWTCRDIWDYIIHYKVPYCILYDLGYTSLGDKSNTIPNPHLQYDDPETGTSTYRKACEMTDDTLERAGRT